MVLLFLQPPSSEDLSGCTQKTALPAHTHVISGSLAVSYEGGLTHCTELKGASEPGSMDGRFCNTTPTAPRLELELSESCSISYVGENSESASLTSQGIHRLYRECSKIP